MNFFNIPGKTLVIAVLVTVSAYHSVSEAHDAFPLNLTGSTPEEASVTVNISKPENAVSGLITLATYDPDFANEGELIINGNTPVPLFGTAGVSSNDNSSAAVTLSTPASYWNNGNNTLIFRHTRTWGYIIDSVTVSFETAISTGGNTGNEAINTPPTISGTSPTQIVAGNYYSFKSIAFDADYDPLTFGISGRPSWASFNNSTGELSGTPTENDIGSTSNIRISVDDGISTVSLPAFNVSVTGTGNSVQTGFVNLRWTAPVARADGSALSLSEITGYTVHYGTSKGNYPQSYTINNGSATSATISNLPVGTYYLVMTTRDTDGRDSGYSTSVTIPTQ